MEKYICTICNYNYDPAEGDPDNDIDPGTAFDNLPDVAPMVWIGNAQRRDYTP
ncbi:MAG: rubredoxin, partial [Candidatus Kapabacteria bacterium]|nr:rubredoxin [Candidatus Kapabacteria bacterium]